MAPIVAPTVANMVLTVGQVFEMFFLAYKALYYKHHSKENVYKVSTLSAVNHGCVD